MKNFLPQDYKKNQKLKINHSYLVEQFADYSNIFKEVEKVVKKGDYTLGGEVDKCEKSFAKRTGAARLVISSMIAYVLNLLMVIYLEFSLFYLPKGLNYCAEI